MKVLFFIDSLTSGGKERRLTELMKILKPRVDIIFELVVMSTDIHYKEVFDLNINIHFIIRKTKKDISVFPKFYKICRNFKPDIVHCWDSMTAIYSAPVCSLLRIKLINGMVINSPIRQNILNKHWLRARLTFPLSDIIIGNSESGLEAYSAPASKSRVVYNGFNFVRTENIKEIGIIREQIEVKTKYVIGMVASFSEFKDYQTYFNAAQLLLDRRNNMTFLAIGNNTDSVYSEALIKNTAKRHFRLLGKLSDVESYVNIMDVCVLSTFTEGISNSILEYMAFGKPVIATTGGGTNEILVDQETGFLVNKSSPQELAEKIEILINDEMLRLKMGKAGKERIQEKFSIDKMVNEYITIYHSVLA